MTWRTILVAINAVGCVLSVLLLLSGILWYPLITLVFGMFGAAVLAVVLGFWFGGYGRVPRALAAVIGNAAVLIGFVSYVAVFSLINGNADVVVVSFYAGATMLVFGYAVLAGTVTRPLFRTWSRSA